MNTLALSAQIKERQAVRYTPAGVPVLTLTLLHSGELLEIKQTVVFEIMAMIFGDAALLAQGLQAHVEYVFHGFLVPKRKGGVQLLLHIMSWEEAS